MIRWISLINLRAHRTKLPPNMRSLGDQYVRKEFADIRDVTKPEVLERLREKNVLYQAYNVVNGIVTREGAAPRAYRVLADVARAYGLSYMNLKDARSGVRKG